MLCYLRQFEFIVFCYDCLLRGVLDFFGKIKLVFCVVYYYLILIWVKIVENKFCYIFVLVCVFKCYECCFKMVDVNYIRE